MITTGEALRFAVGTFTRLPVRPPGRIDAQLPAWAMALGPLVGAGLGIVGGLPLLIPHPAGAAGPVAALLALLAVGLTAWLTRGLHWDGLADLADGLGSGAAPERARDVMKRSDIGPFGVLTMVVVLGVQVLALAGLGGGWHALAGWAAALALGRFGIAVACGPWARPATAAGLGAMVVGVVGLRHLAVASLLTLVVLAIAGVTAAHAGRTGPAAWLGACTVLLATAVVVAGTLTRLAARRLGGNTGDVLGACAELTTAAAMVVLVLLEGAWA